MLCKYLFIALFMAISTECFSQNNSAENDSSTENIVEYDSIVDLMYYSDSINASSLTPSEWIKSKEFIPPKSNSKLPITTLLDTLLYLSRNNNEILRSIFTERYLLPKDWQTAEIRNPDKILAWTMIMYQNKDSATTIILYFYDETNTFIAELTNFKGSPSRIYFNTNKVEKDILEFGSKLGIKITKEKEQNIYSMSWKEYELTIACMFSYKKKSIEAVKIGEQVWMKNNLDVVYYRNGDEIPQVTDSTEWANLSTGAWCYYYNNSDAGKVFGKLYNWYAVNDPRGLAPDGWHLPTDEEWEILENSLGSPEVAGAKMKKHDEQVWVENSNATNESNFSALPGGVRHANSYFELIMQGACFWTSTENREVNTNAWFRMLTNVLRSIDRYHDRKTAGMSVRCIKE